MIGKLKALAGAAIALLLMALGWMATSRKAEKARADYEAASAAGANTQLDQLVRAQAAARDSGAAAQEEVDDAEKAIKRGDLSGMDNHF